MGSQRVFQLLCSLLLWACGEALQARLHPGDAQEALSRDRAGDPASFLSEANASDNYTRFEASQEFRPAYYDYAMFWGFTVNTTTNTLQYVNGTPMMCVHPGAGPECVWTAFAFRQEPFMLNGDVRAVGIGTSADPMAPSGPGFNPSFVELPSHLKQAFPSGRWLATFRIGEESEHCPEQLAGPLMDREVFGLWGSVAAVLDADFRTIASAKIQSARGTVLETTALSDVKPLALSNGELFIAFNAYSVDHAGFGERDYGGFLKENGVPNPILGPYRLHELVGTLDLSVNASDLAGQPQLEARVDFDKVRMPLECPELNMTAPGPHKNLGFFRDVDTDELQVLDWIAPTQVGSLNLDDLTRPPVTDVCQSWNASGEPFAMPMPFGHYEDVQELNLTQVLDGVVDTDLEQVQPHNNVNPVYIPSLGEYLGIGHFMRFPLDWYYSHFFYTISKGPPFSVRRMSREFCLESTHAPQWCEAVQYASGMVLDGDKLHIGFGVMDCEARVVTVPLAQVLAELNILE